MDRVPSGRRKGSLNPRVVVLDSSDSDSEGNSTFSFLDIVFMIELLTF